jgi:hypothetical protein
LCFKENNTIFVALISTFSKSTTKIKSIKKQTSFVGFTNKEIDNILGSIKRCRWLVFFGFSAHLGLNHVARLLL